MRLLGQLAMGLCFWWFIGGSSNITRFALLRHILVDLDRLAVVIISGIILLIQPRVLKQVIHLIDPLLSLILALLTLFLGIKTGRESWKLFKS